MKKSRKPKEEKVEKEKVAEKALKVSEDSQPSVALTRKTKRMLEKTVSELKCKREAFVNIALQYIMLDIEKVKAVERMMKILEVDDKGVSKLEKEGY